jgi:hypothetical protein
MLNWAKRDAACEDPLFAGAEYLYHSEEERIVDDRKGHGGKFRYLPYNSPQNISGYDMKAGGMASEHSVEVTMYEKMEPFNDTADSNTFGAATKLLLIPDQPDLLNKSWEKRKRKSWWWWIFPLMFIFINTNTKPGWNSPALDLNTELLNSCLTCRPG